MDLAVAGGPAIRASEILVAHLPRTARPLVTVGKSRDPVAFSVRRGDGMIIFSGALDAWRYRASGQDAFARFWQSVLSEAASSAQPRLSVQLDSGLVQVGRPARVRATLRATELSVTPQGTVTRIGARVVGPDRHVDDAVEVVAVDRTWRVRRRMDADRGWPVHSDRRERRAAGGRRRAGSRSRRRPRWCRSRRPGVGGCGIRRSHAEPRPRARPGVVARRAPSCTSRRRSSAPDALAVVERPVRARAVHRVGLEAHAWRAVTPRLTAICRTCATCGGCRRTRSRATRAIWSALDGVCGEEGARRSTRSTLRDLEAFAATPDVGGLSPRSVARAIACVRGYYRFLLLEKRIGAIPPTICGPPRAWPALPKYLDLDEVDRLLAAAGPDDAARSARQGARSSCCTRPACASRELLSLKPGDVNLDAGYLTCIGKGDKQRIVPLGHAAADWVRRYVRDGAAGAARRAIRKTPGCS